MWGKMDLNDLIYVSKDQISEEFCNHVIEKFNNDDRRSQGVLGSNRRIDKSVKDSTDLVISGIEGWEEEDNVFYKSVNSNLHAYCDNIPKIYRHYLAFDTSDTGYQIQRTDPGGGYIWHTDQIANRKLTFIWYLNNIEEDGYTEFNTGLKIQPETGKFVLFPSAWAWHHRGYPPKSEVKYIATGWMHSEANVPSIKGIPLGK